MFTPAEPITSPVSSEGGDEYARVVRYLPTDRPLGLRMVQMNEAAGFGYPTSRALFSTEEPVGAVVGILR